MSILIDNDTKLCVSGITGREGTFHALNNKKYGTNVVSGATLGREETPLRVVLATTHVALRDVPRLLTSATIAHAADLTRDHLRRWFGVAEPRIALAQQRSPRSGCRSSPRFWLWPARSSRPGCCGWRRRWGRRARARWAA